MLQPKAWSQVRGEMSLLFRLCFLLLCLFVFTAEKWFHFLFKFYFMNVCNCLEVLHETPPLHHLPPVLSSPPAAARACLPRLFPAWSTSRCLVFLSVLLETPGLRIQVVFFFFFYGPG